MRLFLLIAAAALPTMATAQPQTETTPLPTAAPPAMQAVPADATGKEVKVNQLIVYGTDACPQSSPEEITVCARLPESERFRIPPDLRDNPGAPSHDSWSNKAVQLEMAGRTGTASCSPVGAGAGAGCLTQLIRQAREEYGGSDVNWTRLIEQAREKRLGRIDTESDEIESRERSEGR